MENKIQIGSICRVVGNETSHYFPIGEKVRVKSLTPYDIEDCICEYLSGDDYWYMNFDDLELVEGE